VWKRAFVLALLGWAGSTSVSNGADLRLAQARYVAIVFNVGSGVLPESTVSPEILREEREAAQRIRAALEGQGRFTVVDRLTEAELLVSIRKGRLVTVSGGTRTGAPREPSAGIQPAPGLGVQLSSPQDMLEVLEPNGALVWRGMRKDGLAGETPPLLQALQAAIAGADAARAKALSR
jgi:hypothetical protein